MKKNLLLLLLVTIIFSCNSDDKTEISNNPVSPLLNSDDKTEISNNPVSPLLISRTASVKPDDAPNYDEFYTYDDEGYLIEADGFTILEGSYKYNERGLLISSIDRDGFNYTYIYDNSDRLIKQINKDTNEYVEFVFDQNMINVRWKRKEFGLDSFYFVLRQLTIDDSKRIVKISNQDLNDTVFEKEQSVIYDENGNIIKYEYINAKGEKRSFDYSYLDIKNPYHSSYKKYWESAYYLRNFFSLSPYINEHGLSPNLLDPKNFDLENKYEAREDNYPIQLTNKSFTIDYKYAN